MTPPGYLYLPGPGGSVVSTPVSEFIGIADDEVAFLPSEDSMNPKVALVLNTDAVLNLAGRLDDPQRAKLFAAIGVTGTEQIRHASIVDFELGPLGEPWTRKLILIADCLLLHDLYEMCQYRSNVDLCLAFRAVPLRTIPEGGSSLCDALPVGPLSSVDARRLGLEIHRQQLLHEASELGRQLGGETA